MSPVYGATPPSTPMISMAPPTSGLSQEIGVNSSVGSRGPGASSSASSDQGHPFSSRTFIEIVPASKGLVPDSVPPFDQEYR